MVKLVAMPGNRIKELKEEKTKRGEVRGGVAEERRAEEERVEGVEAGEQRQAPEREVGRGGAGQEVPPEAVGQLEEGDEERL